MRKVAQRFFACERGISSIEYAVLLAFVGVTIALAAVALGNAVVDIMTTTTDQLND
ncbi:MAG: hypothetical protein IT445_11940 [Phycisphaeraceae bacterium]|nr:hypothetical protein [Phycisphaeraceae bacterium]